MGIHRKSVFMRHVFCGILATGTLSHAAMQPAAAATVTCSAIDTTSIASGVPPSFSTSCGTINPGDDFVISYTGALDVSKIYSLEIANINDVITNSQTFKNVQLLVSGAIGSTPFTDKAITIWPTNNGSTIGSPVVSQGLTGYATNPSTDTFNSVPVSTAADFTLTSPIGATQLGTAGLIQTAPLQLSTQGITSFTGFKITGTFFSGSGPFAAGLGIFNNSVSGAPDQILGNAYNVPAPAPLPLLGIGAALGWSRRLRRRISATKA
jgi:hypothetical protein